MIYAKYCIDIHKKKVRFNCLCNNYTLYLRMEKSFLKESGTHTTDIIDISSGEIVETIFNKTTYLANTKEEFYLMYSSMVLILKGSTDVKMKLFAALLERYSKGQEFSMSKSLKLIIAQETNCKPRSFDTAFSHLIKDNIVVKISSQLYRINPRHVFQGSSNERNNQLKAILELYCTDC